MTERDDAALLGREAEVAAVGGLITRACSGESGALALIGSAGTGKTTLLREAEVIAAGGDSGVQVLRARGIESEAELPFGGLLELVRPITGLITRLPEPQANALEGALALAPSAGTDRFSVSAATLGILGLAAGDAPVLVVVDDLHWIDPPSAEAIMFAARRLWREGVAMLLSARPEDLAPGELEGIDRVAVAPLTRDESARLARRVAERDLNDEDVEALYVGTGGNPLGIIEATRSLGGAGDALAGVILPLPVADRIRVGVERRLARLRAPERTAVLIAAAAGTEAPCALVEAALAGSGLTLGALSAAEASGILRIRGGTIAFEHPLTRSAAYAAAPGPEQREAHRTLALVSPADSAERAWHLSAAAVGVDEEAAAALERWGEDALARGAPSSAMRAFDRAALLSVGADEAARRLLRGAGAARLAGMTDRAREALAEARERTSDQLVRADALALLFQIDAWSAPLATARSITAEADRIAALDPERAARLLAEAATALMRTGDMDQGARMAERARAQALAQGLHDDAIEVAVLFARVADARAPEAVEGLNAAGERLLLVDPPGAHIAALIHQVAWLHIWTERYALAAQLLAHAVAEGRSHSPGTLPMALAMRAELGYRRGRWRVAQADAAEAASLAVAFEQAHPRGLALACQARIEACRGSEDECREVAAEAARIGSRLGGADSPISAWGSPALGLLELGRGRPDAATPHFEKVATTFARGGIREPGVVLTGGDLVECHVRTGRRAEAASALAVFEDLAGRADRIGARAIAARCRGLLAGDDAFAGPFEEALRLHGQVDMPFEEARTRLCLGERLRRARRRADARVHLRAALEAFERLGAVDWAATAREELGVTGETAAPRSGPRSDSLTPQELQVALMVASGVTNREAGARLFLSAKTIEAHLGRIYRKLGVRSRTELATRVAQEGLGEDVARTAVAAASRRVATDDGGRAAAR
jgi:DNA-binding CsgD family transcriptional regulator